MHCMALDLHALDSYFLEICFGGQFLMIENIKDGKSKGRVGYEKRVFVILEESYMYLYIY